MCALFVHYFNIKYYEISMDKRHKGNMWEEDKNIIIKNLSKFSVLVVKLDCIKLVAGRWGFAQYLFSHYLSFYIKPYQITSTAPLIDFKELLFNYHSISLFIIIYHMVWGMCGEDLYIFIL